MRELFRSTTAYRAIARDARRGEQAHFTLVLFPDGRYLRDFLTLCAGGVMGGAGARRSRSRMAAEGYAGCPF